MHVRTVAAERLLAVVDMVREDPYVTGVTIGSRLGVSRWMGSRYKDAALRILGPRMGRRSTDAQPAAPAPPAPPAPVTIQAVKPARRRAAPPPDPQHTYEIPVFLKLK